MYNAVRIIFQQLNFMQTMYNIDLENPKDPLCKNMKIETTFHISNIDPNLRTHNIVRKISGHDYEIIWIDDTSVLLAAKDDENASSMTAVFHLAFGEYDIQSLEDEMKHSSK